MLGFDPPSGWLSKTRYPATFHCFHLPVVPLILEYAFDDFD